MLSDKEKKLREARNKFLGIEEKFSVKSYYPLLKEKISQLQESEAYLHDKSLALMNMLEDLEEEKKKADENETKYRMLVENQNDLVVKVDTHNRFLYVSPSYCYAFGKKEEELIGFSFTPLVNKEDLIRNKKEIKKLLSPPYTCQIEIRAKTNDGWRWFHWSNKAEINENNEIISVISVGRDIDERKQAEEALRKSENSFRELFDFSADGVLIISKERIIIEVNNAFIEMLGFDRDYFINRKAIDLPFTADSLKNKPFRFDILDSGKVFQIERSLIRQSGEIIHVDMRSKKLPDGNYQSIYRDITEQKKSEQIIIENQQRLLSLINSTPDIICFKDAEGRWLEANNAILELFSLNKIDYRGKNDKELSVQSLPLLSETFNHCSQTDEITWQSGKITQFEELIPLVDGATKIYDIVKIPIYENDSQKKALVILGRDITERKKTQEKLQKNEAILRSLLDGTPVGVGLLQNRTFIQVNKALCELSGYSEEEMINHSARMLYQNEIHFHQMGEILYRDMENKGIGIIETQLVKKNGEKFDTIVSLTPFDINNPKAGVCATMHDITVRKRAEQMVRENEQRLLTLINSTPDIICFKDGSGRWLEANNADLELFGLTNVDYKNKTDSELAEYTLPIYRQAFQNCEIIDEKAWLAGGILQSEEIIPKPDGTLKIYDVIKVPIFEEDGSRKGLVVLGRDITERKKAEQDLRTNEAILQSLFDGTPVGVGFLINRKFIRANKSFCRITGYSENELMNHNTRILYSCDEDYKRVGELLYQNNKNDEISIINSRFKRKDGKIIDVVLSQSPLNPNDPSAGVCATAQDVTEKKRAEENVRKNEAILRSLLDGAPIGVGLLVERRFVRVNKTLCELTGYSENELHNQLSQVIYYDEEEYLRVGKLLYEDMEKNGVGKVESRFRKKDGSIVDVIISLTPFDPNDSKAGVCATAQDITEQKRANKALRESEARFRELAELLPEVVYETDETGKFTFVNRISIDMFGYDSKDIEKGLYFYDMLIPEERQAATENVIKRIKGENVGSRIYTGLRKDGSTFPILLHNSLIVKEGKFAGSRGVVIDMTERKKVEDALKESEIRYRSVVEDQTEMIARFDKEGYLTFVNKAYQSYFGPLLNLEQIVGKNIKEIMQIKNYDAVTRFLNMLTPENPIREMEREFQGYDGNIYNQIYSVRAIFSDNGSVTEYQIVGRDITEKKRMEKALSESEEKLSALFSSMTEMVALHELIFNENGEPVNYKITDVNDAFTKITGIPKENAIGKFANEVYGTDTPPYLNEFTQVGITGKPFEYTDYFAPMDKHFMISVISHQKNKFATITTDITTIKQIEQVIKSKNKELENYLYVASHDLRSPLVNIQGFSLRFQKNVNQIKSLLEKIEIDEESKSKIDRIFIDDIPVSLNYILTNVAKMDNLINGLLQISRTGRVVMNIIKINMNKLFQTIIEAKHYQISHLGVTVNLHNLDDCYGDENLLNQLFSNLIENTIKYREPSRPLIIDINSVIHYNKVVYNIKDNGVGIAPRHLERIWDVFYRVDSSHKESGEGLGLNIVKRITDKHKGRVWVESEEDKGSVFHVELYKNEFFDK